MFHGTTRDDKKKCTYSLPAANKTVLAKVMKLFQTTTSFRTGVKRTASSDADALLKRLVTSLNEAIDKGLCEALPPSVADALSAAQVYAK